MNKISVSSSEYFGDKLYQYNGLEFQTLFNKIMQQLDNQFYPIKQKKDFGNDGYSPKYKAQFACYSPEKSKTDTAIISKLKGDWKTFQKAIEENPQRLTKLEKFIFVVNVDVLPKPIVTFIRNCEMEGIEVEHWERFYLQKEAEYLTNEQFKEIFPTVEFHNNSDKDNILIQEFELTAIKDVLSEYENIGIIEARNFIDSILIIPTLSERAKQFCKAKKLEFLLNSNKIEEADEYYQQAKNDLSVESSIIIQASLYFHKKEYTKLHQHILSYINLDIKNNFFWFFVAFSLSEDEIKKHVDIDDVKGLSDFKRGVYLRLKQTSIIDVYNYITEAIEKNYENKELVSCYIESLLAKYRIKINDFKLTEQENMNLSNCIEIVKDDLYLYMYVLFLLKQYDKIDLDLSKYVNNSVDDYLPIVLCLTCKYHTTI